MITCPSCGAACEADARFCLECGESLEGVGSAQPDDPWLGRMIAGRFQLLSKLGDGGMGEVYRAEQLPMGRHIALKILRRNLSDDPKQVERFKREAQAASALSHPNTIIVHDFGQDTDGTLFIAMELLEGRPLNEVLESEGPLSPERAVTILRQVCGSLEEAHSQGLVHRDLKPENVFLTERAGAQDFVKVLDFGIAKVTESGGQKLDTITQAGAIFGTPQYMAPEQIRGEGVDARADIYALGVILYEMISGHLPFAAGSVVEMLTKHLTAPPAPIARTAEVKVDPNLPRLEAIALRALSKDPTRRQQSARAFLEDLMAAMPQLSLTTSTGLIAAAPVLDVTDAPVTSSGNAGKVVLVAAILAALGVGGYFFLGQNGGGLGPVDAAPAALLQPAGDNGGGGGAPASDAPASQPASDAPSSQPASAASAAPATTAEPTDAEKKAAAEAEKKAEEQAKKDEEEAKKAAADANKPLSDEEAKRIAAAAEAEAKQAEAEAKKAAAEKAAKAQAEKAKKAEADRKAAEAAKANAEAAKQAAQQQAAEAKAAAEAAKAQAKEAEAKAKAEAAKNEAEKQAALAAQKKAADEAAKAKAEAEKIKAAAAEQAAAAAKLKAEADALKAQLAKIEEEKAAAAAAEAEAKAKREEAKAKAAAARKKKRATSARSKVYIRTRTIGGRIWVDGKLVGRSPVRVSLKPGKHRIKATNRKGRSTNKTIKVKAGKVQRIKLPI